MARKAYIGTIEVEIIFTADEDVDDISQVAVDAMKEASSDLFLGLSHGEIDYEVATYLPSGWTEDCLCYGSHKKDMTVGQALSETPEYVESVNKMKALSQSPEYIEDLRKIKAKEWGEIAKETEGDRDVS